MGSGRFATGFDVDTSDSLVHSHIPFAVILLHCASEWKEGHEGKVPTTTAERREFKVKALFVVSEGTGF